ncbi:MAG: hypothetical protein F4Y00_01730 [Bacteroidetes bacterium SB0662_bin_6]|nr:hypothetical protein [Bacteroidetes bacterium SB0668_bin_1]MYE03684.1 hypothetical protein [Bacteroidetes bacterium SB0662_bin_6]
MKRILAFLFVLVFPVVGSTPMFGQNMSGQVRPAKIILLPVPEDTLPPIHTAIREGDIETVRTLIDIGVDINEKVGRNFAIRSHRGFTPLHMATTYGETEIIKLLIEKGADVDDNLLHFVHTAEISQLFMTHGADLGAEHKNGTPLHTAAFAGNAEITDLFIKNGADANARDAQGNTPLHHAWNAETAQVLIAGGADLEVQNNYNGTPLHHAVSRDDIAFVQLLIDRGAGLNAKNNTGHTPLDIAINKRRTEIAALLREHGGVETE